MLRPPQVVGSQSQMRLNRGLGSLHIAVDRLGEQRGRAEGVPTLTLLAGGAFASLALAGVSAGAGTT